MQPDWLTLLHHRRFTTPEKRKLVRAFGGPGEVLRADDDAVEEILGAHTGRRRKSVAKVSAAEAAAADAEILAGIGGRFIGFSEAGYPPLLNEIQNAPLGLFVLGAEELLRSPQLAIVGSRDPTPSGRRTTEQFAADLSRLGLTITSGMAFGIDHAAHRGCLDAGGKTIAVTASGIDAAYPRALSALHREIAARGLLVSEYSPGAPPKREHFPQRNRIISGLSLGTLVVEAGMRSGSLITARLAGEQGREVFAVPGSIHVEVSRGCHRLIRQGAKLVECSADITEELGQFFDAAEGVTENISAAGGDADTSAVTDDTDTSTADTDAAAGDTDTSADAADAAGDTVTSADTDDTDTSTAGTVASATDTDTSVDTDTDASADTDTTTVAGTGGIIAKSVAVTSPPIPVESSPDTSRVHGLIDYTPTGIDDIISQSGLTADQVAHILMQLELRGLIAESSGGYQRLPQ